MREEREKEVTMKTTHFAVKQEWQYNKEGCISQLTTNAAITLQEKYVERLYINDMLYSIVKSNWL